MIQKAKDLLRDKKDQALAKALKEVVNLFAGEVGELRDVLYESKERRLNLTVMLKGESSPLVVTVEGFAVVAGEKEGVVLARKVYTSREWLNVLIEKRVKDLSYPVPAALAKGLKPLL